MPVVKRCFPSLGGKGFSIAHGSHRAGHCACLVLRHPADPACLSFLLVNKHAFHLFDKCLALFNYVSDLI